ncbi:hypothetical protein [Gilvimarinus agarilyticus]|uniref:hypothetical protein n=1 Tax=Gilvimarinus agarilyticus TaxID=679259 RepID=UPI0005A10A8E|nr:hypothetical protein [Gilvimarinus agarilyticus]
MTFSTKLKQGALWACSGLVLAPLALAHPNHGAEPADHVHFSLVSLLFVGAALVGYFAFARKSRAQSRQRVERQSKD